MGFIIANEWIGEENVVLTEEKLSLHGILVVVSIYGNIFINFLQELVKI